LTDKILLEFTLVLDPFKTIYERESASFLDFLDSLGGFYGALDMCVFWIGEFFSARLFMASIASTFYSMKRPDEDKDKKKGTSKEF
jgi:hypothetical protein